MKTDWRARVELPFGQGRIDAALPSGWALDFLGVMGPADLPEPEAALRQCLEHPIHSLPLNKRLPASGPILFLVDAETRAGAIQDLLPRLIQPMLQGGLRRSDLHCMVVSRGDKPLGSLDVDMLLGEELLSAHPHFAHDPDGPCLDLGHSSLGTLVEVDARLADYRLLVALAPIRHHRLMGFSGGRDLLAPGALSRRSRNRLARIAQGENLAMEPGRLQGNAMHEELSEMALMLEQPVFLINWISGSRPGRYAGFWAGDLRRSFQRACQAYLGWRAFPVLAPGYDFVLSASGGQPGDDDPSTVIRGMLNACRLLRPGGHLLHAAACRQGPVPGADLLEALRPWMEQGQLFLFSEVAPDWLPDGVRFCRHLEEGLSEVLRELPEDPAVALFPDAMELLPVHA